MLFLLSPAKSLDFDSPVPAPVARRATEPVFTDDAAALIRLLRGRSALQVAALMSLSAPLAELNVARYAAWQPVATPANSKPAILAFDGDVYGGLDARSLSTADLAWAQDHLVILSGLYGALRPFDRLQPYRLEMGTALPSPRGRNLYDWWGDRLAQHLDARLAGERQPLLVNLASEEYAQAALRPALRARVVDVRFEDWHGGAWKVVSFWAKRARGLMARHAVRVRARSVRALEAFDAEGYAHAPEVSTPARLVFRRARMPD